MYSRSAKHSTNYTLIFLTALIAFMKFSPASFFNQLPLLLRSAPFCDILSVQFITYFPCTQKKNKRYHDKSFFISYSLR